MIETPSLEDLGLPDVLYDHDSGTEWHLSDPNVSVAVVLHRDDPDAGDPMEHAGSYPIESIRSKIEHGDLETESSEPEPAFECDDCGDTFETEHGLLTHQGAAHGDDDEPVDVDGDE